MRIAILDAEINGKLPRNIIPKADSGLYELTVNSLFITALTIESNNYRTLLQQYSEFPNQTGLNMLYGKFNHPKFFKYLSSIPEPQFHNSIFKELKERVALLIYIQEFLVNRNHNFIELLQFTIEDYFVSKFNSNIVEYFTKEKANLVKKFDSTYIDALYSMIVNYYQPEDLVFNVGIFCTHPVFNYIESSLHIIKSFASKEFNSIKDLLQTLHPININYSKSLNK